MMDDRSVADFHTTRVSGSGCPETKDGPHYYVFIDPTLDYRMCMDCGDLEVVAPAPDTEARKS